MNKWLRRTVGTVGLAGGIWLLGTGAAHAAGSTASPDDQLPVSAMLHDLFTPAGNLGVTLDAPGTRVDAGMVPGGPLSLSPNDGRFGLTAHALRDNGQPRNIVIGGRLPDLTRALPVTDVLPTDVLSALTGTRPTAAAPDSAPASPDAAVTGLPVLDQVTDAAPATSTLASALPLNGTQSTLPLDLTPGSSPADQLTSALPLGELVSALPVDELTSALPVGDLVSALPVDELTAVLPVDEITPGVAPRDLPVGGSPAGDSSADPVVGTVTDLLAEPPVDLDLPVATDLPVAGDLLDGRNPLDTGELLNTGGLFDGTGLPVFDSLLGQSPTATDRPAAAPRHLASHVPGQRPIADGQPESLPVVGGLVDSLPVVGGLVQGLPLVGSAPGEGLPLIGDLPVVGSLVGGSGGPDDLPIFSSIPVVGGLL